MKITYKDKELISTELLVAGDIFAYQSDMANKNYAIYMMVDNAANGGTQMMVLNLKTYKLYPSWTRDRVVKLNCELIISHNEAG